MKKLLFLFLMVTACQTEHVLDPVVNHNFPLQYQGFYTIQAGQVDVPNIFKKFRITPQYLISQSLSDGQNTIYKIRTIQDHSSFIFISLDNAYKDEGRPQGLYRLTILSSTEAELQFFSEDSFINLVKYDFNEKDTALNPARP